jgi:hypothetical protein
MEIQEAARALTKHSWRKAILNAARASIPAQAVLCIEDEQLCCRPAKDFVGRSWSKHSKVSVLVETFGRSVPLIAASLASYFLSAKKLFGGST